MGEKIIKLSDIPGNSNTDKIKQSSKRKHLADIDTGDGKSTDKKKLDSVVTTNVTKQKQSFGKRFADSFFGDTLSSVGQYVLHDVLIPSAKATITDLISGGTERMLFGEARGNRTSRDRGVSRVNYNSIYDKAGSRNKPDYSQQSRRNNAMHNFDDIVIPNRNDAERVLDVLLERIDIYGEASVADFYDLVNITSDYTQEDYGWESLAKASIIRARRGGYIINLPTPIKL